MRQRIDLGAGLVALGAIGLLISLFLDWFSGASAWQSFEIVDWLLAPCAVAALVAAVLSLANATAAPRWMRGVILAALALVVSQLIDPPPGFSNNLEREAGIWLALASAALMALAVALAAARVSVTVDVRGRERRRRVSAVDRRDEAAGGPAAAPPPPPPPAAGRDPERTQPLRPI